MDLTKEILKSKKHRTLRVCRVMQVSRANQYKNPHPRPKRYVRKEDNQVLTQVLNVTERRGTYGYPRTTALINRARRVEGLPVWNKKRVHRVMAIHGLLLEKQMQKPKRPHLGQIITIKSNIRYCSDIFEIKCWN